MQILGQNLPQQPGFLTGRGQTVSGILAGLQGLTGVAGGIQAARDAETLRQEAVKQEAEKQALQEQLTGVFGGTKDPFLTAISIVNDPEKFAQLNPQSQADLRAFISSRSKAPEILQAQAAATERGKLKEQVELKDEIQRRVEQAKADVISATKPAQIFAEKQAADLSTVQSELADLEAGLPDLQLVVDQLKDLAKEATFTKAGQVKDLFFKEALGQATPGAIARTEFQSVIDNQILRQLKETFGAAFTVQEGESLKATLGDVNKTPEEKIASLEVFIAQKIRNIESKRRRVGLPAQTQQSTPAQSTGGIQQEFSPQDIEAELRRRGL